MLKNKTKKNKIKNKNKILVLFNLISLSAITAGALVISQHNSKNEEIALDSSLKIFENDIFNNEIEKKISQLDTKKVIKTFEKIVKEKSNDNLAQFNLNTNSLSKKFPVFNVLNSINLETNATKIVTNIENIINGNLKIKDIKNLASEASKKFPKIYQDSLKRYNFDDIHNIKLINLEPKEINETLIENNNNEIKAVQDIRTIDIGGGGGGGTSADEEKEVYDLLLKINNYQKSIEKIRYWNEVNYGFAVASATLTAIAWGVSATYWGLALTSFGSTIASAIAATVQAGFLTYYTTEAWNQYYSTENDLKEIDKILSSQENQKLVDFATNFIERYTTYNVFKRNIHVWVNTVTNISYLKNLAKKIVDKTLSSVLTKSYQKLSSFILKKVSQEILKFSQKIEEKKTGIAATSWANPISTTILVIDKIIRLGTIINDITNTL